MLDRGHAVIAEVALGPDVPVAIIGVLNVSPESFYAGSVRSGRDDLVRAALTMVQEGARVVDVGARSTAPYRATDVDEAEECRRLGQAVEALAAKLPVPISVDTTRPVAARAALEAGARILNDESGLADPRLTEVALEHGAGLILMASPDAPDRGPAHDPIDAVAGILAAVVQRARWAGIPDERVVLDPGIGFFRHESVSWDAWDLAILAGLRRLTILGRPLCVGVSRKSFIGAVTGRADPDDRLAGSLAATTAAVLNGAAAVRTHDVRATLDAVRVAERVRVAAP